MQTHEEEYCLPLKSKPTSVAISRDSRHMLVNLSEGQIQLIDIDTTEVVRRFQGQKQGSFVIRSAFGGAAENFAVSGSEGKISFISFALLYFYFYFFLLADNSNPQIHVSMYGTRKTGVLSRPWRDTFLAV